MRSAPRTLLVAALHCLTVAHAAPSTADGPDATRPTEAEDRRLQERSGTGEPQGDERTIDLLIDMQKRSAGVQFEERRRATGSSEIRAPSASTTPGPAASAVPGPTPSDDAPPITPAGLFGTATTPTVHANRAATVPDPRTQASVVTGPPSPGAGAARSEPLPEWLMWPREAIQYVRENRGFVLGILAGTLTLAWGVSRLFARAAANASRLPGVAGSPGDPLSDGRWGASRRGSRRGPHRSHRHPH